MAKNGPKWQKIMSVSLHILGTVPLVHLCKMMISPVTFFLFSKFWFFVFLGGEGKGQKVTHNYQFQSVTLNISRTLDHTMKIVGTQVWNNDISRCFSLFFFYLLFFKIFVNIKILIFFIGPHQQFFLIKSCFSISSINAKQKFWGVPHLHMCVIFYTTCLDICLASFYILILFTP